MTILFGMVESYLRLRATSTRIIKSHLCLKKNQIAFKCLFWPLYEIFGDAHRYDVRKVKHREGLREFEHTADTST